MTKTKIATGITLSCLTVSDIKKAKHLFVDLLGLDIKEYNEQYKWLEIGSSEEPEAQIGIGQYHKDNKECETKPGSNAIVSISVENIEVAKEHLEANGISFCGDIMEVPGETKLALFKDEDGNQYFLCQRLRD